MTHPPNSPDGDSGPPDHQFPPAHPPQPSHPLQQSSYRSQPSFPSQPSYRAQQPPHRPPPDYPRAAASGGPAVGSSHVYEPTRPMPTGDLALPPYGQPFSGPPYPPTPPGLRLLGGRGRGIGLLLPALLVLLLLVGGVMTALYVTKNGELGDARQDLAAREARVKDLELRLQKAKDDMAGLRQDLTGTQSAQQETERQKQVISGCLSQVAELGRAAQRDDRAAYQKAAKEVDKTCTEAEKYLD